jgi:hypothetical protein
MGWGEQAVLQPKGDAAVWAMHRFKIGSPIEWFTFCTELNIKSNPSNALYLAKCKWEEQSFNKREFVTNDNKRFRCPHSNLDSHQPVPAVILVHADGYMIKLANQGVYVESVHYIGIRDSSPTLKQHMDHLATLDISLNKCQPGYWFNINTIRTTKASAEKIGSKQGSTTGTLTGPAQDDDLPCSSGGRVCRNCRNCATSDMKMKLLDLAHAKNISVWAEWLRQSGRAPSGPSQTPRWGICLRPASMKHVKFHIAHSS